MHDDDLALDPIPPGHGEPGTALDGSGSNVQDDWAFDPTPIPETSQGFRVENHGSIFLIEPRDKAARTWLSENVDLTDVQWFGFALAVEGRYVFDLVDGILDAGFEVS